MRVANKYLMASKSQTFTTDELDSFQEMLGYSRYTATLYNHVLSGHITDVETGSDFSCYISLITDSNEEIQNSNLRYQLYTKKVPFVYLPQEDFHTTYSRTVCCITNLVLKSTSNTYAYAFAGDYSGSQSLELKLIRGVFTIEADTVTEIGRV